MRLLAGAKVRSLVNCCRTCTAPASVACMAICPLKRPTLQGTKVWASSRRYATTELPQSVATPCCLLVPHDVSTVSQPSVDRPCERAAHTAWKDMPQIPPQVMKRRFMGITASRSACTWCPQQPVVMPVPAFIGRAGGTGREGVAGGRRGAPAFTIHGHVAQLGNLAGTRRRQGAGGCRAAARVPGDEHGAVPCVCTARAARQAEGAQR
eukprot:366496-Chlamydomonas_euryale.AAC.26